MKGREEKQGYELEKECEVYTPQRDKATRTRSVQLSYWAFISLLRRHSSSCRQMPLAPQNHKTHSSLMRVRVRNNLLSRNSAA